MTAGLNKGEAKNTLARAVCFNRLGEIRDRTYELQRHRASGLNLVVAAIILWNTVYLERAVSAMRAQGYPIDDALLKHVAPIHWNHINLTGDYPQPLIASLKDALRLLERPRPVPSSEVAPASARKPAEPVRRRWWQAR